MRWHFLILAWLCNVLFRYEPLNFSYGDPSEGHTMYTTAQAMSYLCLLLFPYPYIKANCTKWQRIFFCVTIACVMSNFADELNFDPIHFGINEVILPLLVFPISYYSIKNKKSGTKPNDTGTNNSTFN